MEWMAWTWPNAIFFMVIAGFVILLALYDLWEETIKKGK